ncbi:hypothetical protein HK102_012971, partial [Quaeritorhiza haematococci]
TQNFESSFGSKTRWWLGVRPHRCISRLICGISTSNRWEPSSMSFCWIRLLKS